MLVEFADLLEGVHIQAVIGEPLLDEENLIGAKTDVLDAAAGIGDGEDPNEMAVAVGANGTTGAVANVAFKERAAEDLVGGRKRRGEQGAGVWRGAVFHISQ